MTSNVTCPPVSTATLSVAVEQFIEAKQAQRLSKNTLIEYNRTLRYFKEFFENEDPLMSAITQVDVRKFMNSLDHLSKKSLLNVHIGLSSLWHWASDEGLCSDNIMHKVARPRPEIRAVQPFTHEEVDRLFNGICFSVEYSRPGKRSCSSRLPYYYRTRANFDSCTMEIFGADVAKISMVQLSKFSEKEPRNALFQSQIAPNLQSKIISNRNAQANLHKMKNLSL